MDALGIAINMTTSSLKCTLSDTPLDILRSNNYTLAVIAHNAESCSEPSNVITTGMPQLGNQLTHEVWSTDANVEVITENGIKIAHTGNILMASCSIEESGQLADDTRRAYEQLLQKVNEHGYPHLLRAWNYIANINEGQGDNERYKQFCAGRYAAFCHMNISESDYPAASALGHASDKITIYLISAKHRGSHIENPSQQSAYTYPKQYGSKSPSFARATVSHELEQTFISGTASITGHETLHIDDVKNQLILTLDNIQKLAVHIENKQQIKLGNSLFKVYIRNVENFPQIQHLLSDLYPDLPCLYLQADICRSDLLLEIEAVFNHL